MSEFTELNESMKKLEREIIEARNMNIKTDNNIRSVFAEMKKVSGNQQTAAKKARIGAIGVYILFVVLIGTGAFLLANVKSGMYESQIAALKAANTTHEGSIKALNLELSQRDAAEKRAVFVLRLIREDKKAEAVVEFGKIDQAKASRAEMDLLTEHINAFRKHLATLHYDRGVAQWRIGGYKTAVQEFEFSVNYVEKTDYSGSLAYYRGLCELQTKATKAGIENLKRASTSDLPRHMTDNARIQIAETYIKAKAYQDALIFMQQVPLDQLGFYTRQAMVAKIKFVGRRLDEQKKAEADKKKPAQ